MYAVKVDLTFTQELLRLVVDIVLRDTTPAPITKREHTGKTEFLYRTVFQIKLDALMKSREVTEVPVLILL